MTQGWQLDTPGHGDLEVLVAVHESAFGSDQAWSHKALEDAFLSGSTEAFGLRAEHGFAAFALVQRVDPEAEILTFAVERALHRKGLGRRLLSEIIETARLWGSRRLYLEVAADNAGARGLYGRAGFVENGRRSKYYRRKDAESVDAILMSLTIAGQVEPKQA